MPNDNKSHDAKAAARAGRWAGKAAVNTGGAAGIGRAAALAFAKEGALSGGLFRIDAGVSELPEVPYQN